MPEHEANYYFLKRFLHPKPYAGYRQSIVNLLVNRNKGSNNGKFLLIEEPSGVWFFPKGHLIGTDIMSSFFESISQNLEKELGLRGMKIFEVKPSFTQLSYIFDFERQKYNSVRQLDEKTKGNPSKGKIYHLAVMEYKGKDDFPINENCKVLESKWVSKEEGVSLLKSTNEKLKSSKGFAEESSKFYRRFFEKVIITHQELEILRANEDPFQSRLL